VLLQGIVRRAANRLRVSAQLTSAVDGVELWSERYEREAKDVFAVQDEIARSIVGALQLTLAAGGHTTQGTKDLEAYDLYLRGRYFLNRRGLGLERAAEYFTEAIARDSSFARAYAGLALSYLGLPFYKDEPATQYFARATAAAERAVRLDPSLAEAHTALASAYRNSYRWDESLPEYQRALTLDPKDALLHSQYSNTLYGMGHMAEEIGRASCRERVSSRGGGAAV